MADMETYARFLLGLVFVLGLILALSWAARRLNLVPGAIKLAQTGKRRLSIVEISAVDAKRRLVLVKRDNVEHLLLLGPTSETVVESGITPPETILHSTASPSAETDSPVSGITGKTT
ncbi:MAG: FliO/MopB family protein [Alphaproteobacteria bacterium]|jgi:flagellar protein FliO/FliZ|nr:FliO/MopB family protein [Alphaproteobacteria bacterium]MBT4084331.1 FliO/MopB family protein [Alphaproteobacteria bacterium]MBT4542769.1 FliO/MopB family protein [Alphaproteobacteria bacterium]MBT7743662.1 FliO/MopB family protein [Alphaproteobacteria bacterium]